MVWEDCALEKPIKPVLKHGSIFFNAEFEEEFKLCRPIMSIYQITMVEKRMKAASNEDISFERIKELYEEAVVHLENAYVNSIMKINREMSRQPLDRVEKMRLLRAHFTKVVAQ